MSESKWHKICGRKVVYREPSYKGAGFGQAGFCIKCGSFPIVEEDIIFEIDDNTVERFYEEIKLWCVMKKEKIPEDLEK